MRTVRGEIFGDACKSAARHNRDSPGSAPITELLAPENSCYAGSQARRNHHLFRLLLYRSGKLVTRSNKKLGVDQEREIEIRAGAAKSIKALEQKKKQA